MIRSSESRIVCALSWRPGNDQLNLSALVTCKWLTFLYVTLIVRINLQIYINRNIYWIGVTGFLTFENYSSNSKDLCPRQRSSMLLAMIGDALLSWAVHDFLWYFLGISAIFVAKDYLSPEYIQVP